MSSDSDPKDDSQDGLDASIGDRLVASLKGAASILPLAGGPLAELIGEIVPNQRLDRLTAYVRALANRVELLDEAQTKALLQDAETIDLVERGAYSAVRATTEDRIAHIVALVNAGLTKGERDRVRRKRLLGVLDALDVDEFSILRAYGVSTDMTMGSDEDDPFESVDRVFEPTMDDTEEDIERHHLYELGVSNLLRLGLLRRRYPARSTLGELPEFDPRTGEFKGSVEISSLGRLLLREIGLPTPYDQERKSN
ncbi:MAG: hypothetical protein ACE37M_11540 [Henriciella sp.]